MNIYQKLIEVRKAVPFLKKDNAGFQFKFVSSSQTLGALREAMDANALVLIPQVTGERVLDHTTKKGDHNYFTILNMVFTWVNAEKPDETIVCPWVGQGLDDGEKGVGKALTYAEKFFLLKFFNIPTDKDDPDANQKAPALPTPPVRTPPKAAPNTSAKTSALPPTPASQVNPDDIPEPPLSNKTETAPDLPQKISTTHKRVLTGLMKKEGILAAADQIALFDFGMCQSDTAEQAGKFISQFADVLKAWKASKGEA
jgi:hypothetical protein